MRNSLYLLILILLLAGCQKNKERAQAEEDGGTATLIGTWEIARTWSGMSPLTNHPAGNGKELIFDSTSYKMVYNGTVVDEGTYQLINGTYTDVNSCVQVPAKDANPNLIVYKNNQSLKHYFELSPSTLRITSGCIPADGGVSEYRRKSSATTFK